MSADTDTTQDPDAQNVTQGEPVERPADVQSDATPAEPAAEVAAAETGTEAAPAETEAEKHKRKGGWQRKIETLERINEQLLERLAAQQGQPTQPAQPAAPAKAKTPDEVAADFIAVEVEKRLAAREAQRQQEAAAAEFQARTQEVRAAHPDFDEVIASVDVRVSPAVQEALLTSKHGPDLMYQLATNPAELARISALPPLVAAREVGRLEAKFASVTAAPKPSPNPAPRKPAAPAPITPVTTRGPTTIKDPASMSYEEYCRYRDSQTKR